MTGPCTDCLTAINYSHLTRRTYSMGCSYCGARYLAHGGQHIGDWDRFGGSSRQATELKMQGELIDPELKRKGR